MVKTHRRQRAREKHHIAAVARAKVHLENGGDMNKFTFAPVEAAIMVSISPKGRISQKGPIAENCVSIAIAIWAKLS